MVFQYNRRGFKMNKKQTAWIKDVIIPRKHILPILFGKRMSIFFYDVDIKFEDVTSNSAKVKK